ncbi:hypothetical protein DJ564_14865 [Pseudomonas sp. 31-12]|nr:hypothetical protein DJ564_14865 [Pseudomonas sp. 31-12]
MRDAGFFLPAGFVLADLASSRAGSLPHWNAFQTVGASLLAMGTLALIQLLSCCVINHRHFVCRSGQ